MHMLMTTNRVREAGRSALRRPRSRLHPQPGAGEVEPRPSMDFRARKAGSTACRSLTVPDLSSGPCARVRSLPGRSVQTERHWLSWTGEGCRQSACLACSVLGGHKKFT